MAYGVFFSPFLMRLVDIDVLVTFIKVWGSVGAFSTPFDAFWRISDAF